MITLDNYPTELSGMCCTIHIATNTLSRWLWVRDFMSSFHHGQPRACTFGLALTAQRFAGALNFTVFGGTAPTVPYMRYPEGVAMRRAWDQYVATIAVTKGAPSMDEYGLTPNEWAERVCNGVAVRQYCCPRWPQVSGSAECSLQMILSPCLRLHFKWSLAYALRQSAHAIHIPGLADV